MRSKNSPKGFSIRQLIKAETLSLREDRKRLYFILKIILFISLVIVQANYPNIAFELGITTYHLSIAIFYILGNIIITTLRLILVNLYIKRNHLKNDYRDNFIVGVDRIGSLLSFFLLVISFFYLFRINPGEVLTSISVVAVALVLLFKDYISNLMSGMIMMFSDQFHLNDYVKVGEFKGRIIDINLANVQIKNDDGEIMYIPNNLVYSKDVINYSKNNTSIIIVDFELHIKFFGILPQLEAYIIQKATHQFNAHVKAESIMLRVEHIKKEEASIKLILTLTKPNKRLEKIIHRYCNFIIVEFLHKELMASNLLKGSEKLSDDLNKSID